MEVDDNIFHLGIVDGPLRLAPPGVERRRIIGIEADHLDAVEVEIEAARILDPAAEYEVQLANERGAKSISKRVETPNPPELQAERSGAAGPGARRSVRYPARRCATSIRAFRRP